MGRSRPLGSDDDYLFDRATYRCGLDGDVPLAKLSEKDCATAHSKIRCRGLRSWDATDRCVVAGSILSLFGEGHPAVVVAVRAGVLAVGGWSGDAGWRYGPANLHAERDRLNDLINTPLTVGEHDALSTEVATLLALVRDERARTRLPNLEQRFTTLAYQHQMDVAAVHPDPYFVPTVINHVVMAWGWRTAERVGQVLVVPHGQYLTEEDLRALLNAWCHNSECRQASGMPDLATELFAATGHLGPTGHAIWQEFLTCVRQLEPEGSYYRYDDVEAALSGAVQ